MIIRLILLYSSYNIDKVILKRDAKLYKDNVKIEFNLTTSATILSFTLNIAFNSSLPISKKSLAQFIPN